FTLVGTSFVHVFVPSDLLDLHVTCALVFDDFDDLVDDELLLVELPLLLLPLSLFLGAIEVGLRFLRPDESIGCVFVLRTRSLLKKMQLPAMR
ncbi:hypothetical protein PFISCL1PPCAC_10982, partial [Pristionchus fissidentatus]